MACQRSPPRWPATPDAPPLAAAELTPATRQAVEVAVAQIDAANCALAPIKLQIARLSRRQPGCRALQACHYGIGPHDYFADLYKVSSRGRPTVPARVLATVMLLQAHEGLSDREAVDRLEVDLRWQAAAGADTGAEGFHPTVLVGQRNRLPASARPRRLHEDVKVVARAAGVLKGRVRVLDSTPLYDAVATQDTVTQLRAAVRKLLMVLDNIVSSLAGRVRAVLERDDDYATAGKPPCDWDDPAAREGGSSSFSHPASHS